MGRVARRSVAGAHNSPSRRYSATAPFSKSCRGGCMPELKKLLFRLIALSLLTASTVCGAHGETTGMASPLGRASSGHEARVTPEQARRALEVLEDDGKRAQTIETLRTIAGALASAQHSHGDSAAAPPKAAADAADPEAAEALTPDSLGAQMLVQVSKWISTISDDIEAAARTITNFPLLWRWIEQTANDPYARGRLFDAAWKLMIVFGCALMLEWLAQRGRAAAHGRARASCRAHAPRAARAGPRRGGHSHTSSASQPHLAAVAAPAAGGRARAARSRPGARVRGGRQYAAGDAARRSGDAAAGDPGGDQRLRGVPRRHVRHAHAGVARQRLSPAA